MINPVHTRLVHATRDPCVIGLLRLIHLWSAGVYDAFRSAISSPTNERLSAIRVQTMTPALERLAELVRQAEAKTRARKIEGEAEHAAELFRAAELRARETVEQFRQMRPGNLRAVEQADADEQLLKDLVASWPFISHLLDRKPMRSSLLQPRRLRLNEPGSRARPS